MFKFFITFVYYEWRVATRKLSEYLNPLSFFILVAALFPVAISTAPSTLQLIAPGVLWITALLATLLSLERLFFSDYEAGFVEQWFLSPYPLSMIVLSKLCVHWLLTGLPLVLVAPFLAQLFYLSSDATWALLFTLLLGTPILVLVGGVGSALTVGMGNQGVLLALLVLPFFIPVIIFGSSAIIAAQAGLAYAGQLAILGAFLTLAITLIPFTIAAALKVRIG